MSVSTSILSSNADNPTLLGRFSPEAQVTKDLISFSSQIEGLRNNALDCGGEKYGQGMMNPAMP